MSHGGSLASQAPGSCFDWDGTCAGIGQVATPIVAETFLGMWPTYSRPAEFLCSDGGRYVLKALCSDRDIARANYNDQVVARLGRHLQAPVGDVTLVRLDATLIAANPNISYMLPGQAHATKRIMGATERIDAISFINLPENKRRFAALSVLFGWMGVSGDRQFIYDGSPPNLIYSVDHGHFFPSGPDWSIASLQADSSPAVPAADLLQASGYASHDLESILMLLKSVSERDIAMAVMAAPMEWGIPIIDRVALARHLWIRRTALLSGAGMGGI